MRAALLLGALALVGACGRRSGGQSTGAGPAASGTVTPGEHGPGASTQAVIVALRYGSRDLGSLHALEHRLEAAIEAAHVGEFDGDEVAVDGSDARLYAYGPDADRLFVVMRPILEAEPFAHGAEVTLRYGIWHEGMRETHMTLP